MPDLALEFSLVAGSMVQSDTAWVVVVSDDPHFFYLRDTPCIYQMQS
jgi:hypothetical protein